VLPHLCLCLLLLTSTANAGKNGNHYGRIVSVVLSPSTATVQTSQSVQFSASISGTSNTAVDWLVNGIAGGNPTVGTITASGVYTAPASVPSSAINVTAQSQAQLSASSSAVVTVVAPAPISVAISPTSAALQTGQSEQFQATVSGANAAVSWLVNGVAGGTQQSGTISSTGLYTAPSTVPSAAVVVTAESTYSPSSSASATVTVSQPVTHQVSLAWSPSTSTVAGYNVYRGTQSAGPYTRLTPVLETATVFTDESVASGATYYYTVTAVDSTGTESQYSNVAQATIP
jgi:hypothetical protein